MKLLHKWLIYLLLVAIPVAVGGVWVLQRLIRNNIRSEVDEQLRSDLLLIQQQAGKPGVDLRGLGNLRTAIAPETSLATSARGGLPPITYTDSVAYDPREGEFEPVRRLTATLPPAPGQSQRYQVTISQPMEPVSAHQTANGASNRIPTACTKMRPPGVRLRSVSASHPPIGEPVRLASCT